MQGLPRPSTTYRRVAVLRTILPEYADSGVCASAGLRRQGRAGPMSATARSGRRMRAIVASDFVDVVAWPPPNGTRLSCGRKARGRKVVEPQIKRLAGEATQFFPTGERPSASSAC